jgi:hypothetical protein
MSARAGAPLHGQSLLSAQGTGAIRTEYAHRHDAQQTERSDYFSVAPFFGSVFSSFEFNEGILDIAFSKISSS